MLQNSNLLVFCKKMFNIETSKMKIQQVNNQTGRLCRSLLHLRYGITTRTYNLKSS